MCHSLLAKLYVTKVVSVNKLRNLLWSTPASVGSCKILSGRGAEEDGGASEAEDVAAKRGRS